MKKYIVMLAYKNITRSKRRTILTFLMLTFGIAFYILMAGLLEGFDRTSFKNTIEFETGHFKIQVEEYDTDRPYDRDHIIVDGERIEKVLEETPAFTGYTGRLMFMGEIDNGRDSLPIITVGLDPVQDATVFNLGQYILQGEFKEGGVVLGKNLINDMGLKIGDLVYLTFRDYHDQVTSVELLISGIIHTPYEKVNNGTAFITLSDAQKAMDVKGVSEYAVMTRADTEDIDELKSYIAPLTRKLSGLTFNRWDQQNQGLQDMVKMKSKFVGMLMFFIIVIGAVGIVNTMLISVLEKRREIGTLKALGMEDRQVMNLFVFEGFAIGIMGSFFGVILGTLFNAYFAFVGIDYSAMAGAEFSFMGVMKSSWPVSAYVVSVCMAVTASVLASYYPAKKVMDMQPVDCLRTVQ